MSQISSCPSVYLLFSRLLVFIIYHVFFCFSDILVCAPLLIVWSPKCVHLFRVSAWFIWLFWRAIQIVSYSPPVCCRLVAFNKPCKSLKKFQLLGFRSFFGTITLKKQHNQVALQISCDMIPNQHCITYKPWSHQSHQQHKPNLPFNNDIKQKCNSKNSHFHPSFTAKQLLFAAPYNPSSI